MAGKIEELPPPALRQGYTDAFEHLVDELLRVRLLLQRLVIRKQERGELSGGGLSVARGEIACFFARPPGAGETEAAGPMAAPGGEQAAALSPALLDGLLGEVRQRIDERLAATGQLGRFRPPLLGLERRFALKPEEMDIVRVLLAPEIDPRFERAYCYCWNDFTRKRPTIGFVLELLADDLRGMEAYRDLLLASGTLRHCGLVLLPAESAGSQESFLARSVLLSPRIVDFLRGRDEPDESIRRYARHIVPELQLDRLVLPEAVRRAALEAAGAALDCWAGRAAVQDGQACPAAARKKAARALHLWGRPHAGKRSLVLAVAAATGRPVWQVDLGTLFAELEQREDQLWAVLREARLSDAVTLLDASADVPADGVPWRTAALLAEAIRAIPGPVFVCAPHRLGWLLHACPALREQPLPMPTADEREKVLVQTLSRLGPCEADLDLPDLASRFGLTGGALVRAAHLAREMADERADEGELRRADLLAACQKELSHRLASLAEQLSSTFGWDDVVLPEATLSRLKELLAYARNRRFILESWGFRHILPYGGGLTVLFTGPPGTGKTMVAGIIARDLGMELFRVDLSRIVDKYVGETEKNLARVFEEAEKSQAILLFDEADSLFSRRTEVRSSVDRYANLEVNFLLQRMESFDGVTILTTNLDQNLDEAFRRRIKFHVAFPFPDEESRMLLWERMLPLEAEVDEDVDLAELAEHHLAGGHIKNAVLRAAVRAADSRRPISREDLCYAATQECMGLGKLIREDE